MQLLPGIEQAPRAYAALYPLAFAALHLSGYDLVISTTASFAQGVRANSGGIHVCYCHSPANFVWRPEAYFQRRLTRALSMPLRGWLKAWDRRSARQPDVYVATGRPVAERIRAFYQRDAAIVPPPIERHWFVPHERDDFYLIVSRLVPHKRVELAIEACAGLDVPLVVAGVGRSSARLRRLAGPHVQFRGYVADDELRSLYARARGVLVTSEEEFGLVSLEAQAAGTPVIAYDAGGARETVTDGVTGVRFSPQTVAGLAAGIRRFEAITWDRGVIQQNAARFDDTRFRNELLGVIERTMEERAPVHVGVPGEHIAAF